MRRSEHGVTSRRIFLVHSDPGYHEVSEKGGAENLPF